MKYIPSIDKKFEPLILKYRAFEKDRRFRQKGRCARDALHQPGLVHP